MEYSGGSTAFEAETSFSFDRKTLLLHLTTRILARKYAHSATNTQPAAPAEMPMPALVFLLKVVLVFLFDGSGLVAWLVAAEPVAEIPVVALDDTVLKSEVEATNDVGNNVELEGAFAPETVLANVLDVDGQSGY